MNPYKYHFSEEEIEIKKSKVIHLGLNILVHEHDKTVLVSHSKSKNYFVLCGMLFIKHFT